MAYKKSHPLRVLLTRGNHDLMMEALKMNEDRFDGFISEGAEKLREKIETYGVSETDEDGNEFVRLGFFEKEAEQFIWQFIASAKIMSDLCETESENTD